MRFISYGAGAIGGVLGAALSAAGHDVTLVARGQHLAAIRRDGLTVRSPDGERTVRLPAVGDPADLDPQPGDVVLLCMKSMDTVPALAAVAARVDPATPVVCVQNGVANEREALRRFANVYGVCVMFPATHLAPGVVEANSAPIPGLLDIGRYPHGLDDTALAVAAAFRSAGFESLPRSDIMRWKYTKLLMNLGNAVDALCGRADPDGLAEVTRLLRAEGVAVLRAAGIDSASAEEDAQRRGDRLQVRPVAGGERGGGSSWQSLARGTGSVEADHLNGEIVLLGRLHGVPTPVNDHARRLANAHASDGRPPGSVRPAEFLAGLAGAAPAR